MTNPVVLSWLASLPFKMQSVVFSGLRGPDNHHAPKLKALVRWLRPVTQRNADTCSDYMRTEQLPSWQEIKKEIEFMSVHYYGHLMKALEIVAYKHPDEVVRKTAYGYYWEMCELLHLPPESESELDRRLDA